MFEILVKIVMYLSDEFQARMWKSNVPVRTNFGTESRIPDDERGRSNWRLLAFAQTGQYSANPEWELLWSVERIVGLGFMTADKYINWCAIHAPLTPLSIRLIDAHSDRIAPTPDDAQSAHYP